MNTYETIISRRSIREFEDKKIEKVFLERYVNAARLAPQAANRQPLEYIIIDDKELLDGLFENAKLAGYLDWTPAKENMARAYIAIVVNKEIQKPHWIGFDAGIAAENICLAAWGDGIGSCMIGAFNKSKVAEMLNVPTAYDLVLLVALGYPAQKSVAEEMKGNDAAYWRTEDGVFHVPKRSVKKITHHNKF